MKAMAKRSLSQQLDELVDAVLAQPEVPEPALQPAEAKLAPLAHLAIRLRGLPRQDFKTRLKTDLERSAIMATKPVMTTKVRPIPEGFRTVTPYLCVKDAAGAIEFYRKAFEATETLRLPMPDGRIGHAEIQIGKSRIMLSDEFPEMGAVSPPSVGGSPVDIHFYVEDVDAWGTRAMAAGARILVPVPDRTMASGTGGSRTHSATAGDSRPHSTKTERNRFVRPSTWRRLIWLWRTGQRQSTSTKRPSLRPN